MLALVAINPHYDQDVQMRRETTFNHNTIAQEIVTWRSNHGSARFDDWDDEAGKELSADEFRIVKQTRSDDATVPT